MTSKHDEGRRGRKHYLIIFMQKLFTALATFREKVTPVIKDANNPFFKSKYADLPAILEVIKQPLHESGLAITHFCKSTES
jgi:hypothetical protein